VCDFIPEPYRKRNLTVRVQKNSVNYLLDYSRAHAQNCYTGCFGENQFVIIQYFLEVIKCITLHTTALCECLGLKDPRTIPRESTGSDLGYISNGELYIWVVVIVAIAFCIFCQDITGGMFNTGLDMAQQQYQNQVQTSATRDKLKTVWNVDDYCHLYKTGQGILQDLINTVLSDLAVSLSPSTLIGDVPGTNIPLTLTKLHMLLQTYQKDLFKKKHTPAPDILVFLISENRRSKKSFGVPVPGADLGILKEGGT